MKILNARSVIGPDQQQRRFLLLLLTLCGFYFAIEYALNSYIELSADEFWFAHNIYHYKDGLPYRDFPPYKTVLGYYLLLPAMLMKHGIIQTLIFVKNTIAFINTLALFFFSWRLARFIPPPAVLASLVLIILSENMVLSSTNIRVDLLGYWLSFFSLILLLEKRYWLAGIFTGLGFITTQKAVWYLFAGDCALGIYWLGCERSRAMLWRILSFNLMSMAVIILYLAFWSWFAGWQAVMHSVFYEASAMYHLAWYSQFNNVYWTYIATFNPFLFLLWPIALVSVMVSFAQDEYYRQRLLITVYALTILLCLATNRQVFPYYMQAALPVLFALFASFFHWLYLLFMTDRLPVILVPASLLNLYTCLCILFPVYAFIKFNLPIPYLIICLIPLYLGLCLTIPKHQQQTLPYIFKTVCALTLVVGVVFPVVLYSISLAKVDGDYQKAHIHAVDALLQDGSDYIAGVDLIYTRNQPIAGMRHLMAPAIEYLASPTPGLRAVMLPSLYEDPSVTLDSVLAALQQSNVKFYVNNYRMEGLPQKLKAYLNSQYQHFWGGIYLYAPQVMAGRNSGMLKFPGKYRVSADSLGPITLNGKSYMPGSYVYLKNGKFVSEAQNAYRLVLTPENMTGYFPAEFRDDVPIRLIF